MSDQPTCAITGPHPPHRTDRGAWGAWECLGVPQPASVAPQPPDEVIAEAYAMTREHSEPRRATATEIATARAWVEQLDWADDLAASPDLQAERRREYEHALEVLIFANGGRDAQPIDWDKVLRERDSLARRCAARFEEAEKLRARVAELEATGALAAEPTLDDFAGSIELDLTAEQEIRARTIAALAHGIDPASWTEDFTNVASALLAEAPRIEAYIRDGAEPERRMLRGRWPKSVGRDTVDLARADEPTAPEPPFGWGYIARVDQLITVAANITVPNDNDRHDLASAIRAVESKAAKLCPVVAYVHTAADGTQTRYRPDEITIVRHAAPSTVEDPNA